MSPIPIDIETPSRHPRRSRRSTVRSIAVTGAVVAAAAIGLNSAITSAQTAAVADASEVEVFVATDPTRYLDTRVTEDPFGPGETRALTIVDVAIDGEVVVPPEATSVAINPGVPASAELQGFVTIWATGDPQPPTAAINAEPGQAVSNFTQSALGDGGAINIFNERGIVDVTIDIVGYYTTLDNVDLSGLGGGLLSGSGAPDDSLGTVGDGYVDEDTGDFYVKADDGYVLVGPDSLGGSVASGDGPPDDSDGDEGDVYLDEETGQIYINIDGTYVPTGTPTAETDAILSAYGTAAAVEVVPDGAPFPFEVDGVSVGDDLERVDDETFQVNTTGVYEVTYRLSTTASVGGSAAVEVSGTPVGPVFTLDAAGTVLTDTVVIEADAGDTIEVVEQGDTLPVGGVNVNAGDNSSISIELIAVTP